jgi:hypothetical protein
MVSVPGIGLYTPYFDLCMRELPHSTLKDFLVPFLLHPSVTKDDYCNDLDIRKSFLCKFGSKPSHIEGVRRPDDKMFERSALKIGVPTNFSPNKTDGDKFKGFQEREITEEPPRENWVRIIMCVRTSDT